MLFKKLSALLLVGTHFITSFPDPTHFLYGLVHELLWLVGVVIETQNIPGGGGGGGESSSEVRVLEPASSISIPDLKGRRSL
jgi:hypothetical protein